MAEEVKQEVVETKTETTAETTEKTTEGIETPTEAKETKIEAKAEPTEEVKKEETTKEEVKEEPKNEVKTEVKEDEVVVEYNFKVPEGIKIEEKDVNQFKEVAKELKLSNDQAQKFMDFTTSQIKFFSDKTLQSFKDTVAEWTKESKSLYTDEQIGRAVDVAKKVGGDKFAELLETTGLGNNPLMVGFLEKVSANYANDKLVVGKASSGDISEKEMLDIKYPNTK